MTQEQIDAEAKAKVEAEANAKAELEAKAKADADEAAKKAAEAAAAAANDDKGAPAKDAAAAATARAADIVAACNLAGHADKAAGFITDAAKDLSTVLAELQKLPAGKAPNTRNAGPKDGNDPADPAEISAGWKKATAKVNKRVA